MICDALNLQCHVGAGVSPEGRLLAFVLCGCRGRNCRGGGMVAVRRGQLGWGLASERECHASLVGAVVAGLGGDDVPCPPAQPAHVRGFQLPAVEVGPARLPVWPYAHGVGDHCERRLCCHCSRASRASPLWVACKYVGWGRHAGLGASSHAGNLGGLPYRFMRGLHASEFRYCRARCGAVCAWHPWRPFGPSLFGGRLWRGRCQAFGDPAARMDRFPGGNQLMSWGDLASLALFCAVSVALLCIVSARRNLK